MDKKYDELLEFLQLNKDKLEVFLSADETAKEYRFRIKGKKKSRTIFMSEQLQFLMNEFCIENSLKIGDFVELAIIEHLNRSGKETELKKLIIHPSTDDRGETGENAEIPMQSTEKQRGNSRENKGKSPVMPERSDTK